MVWVEVRLQLDEEWIGEKELWTVGRSMSFKKFGYGREGK